MANEKTGPEGAGGIDPHVELLIEKRINALKDEFDDRLKKSRMWARLEFAGIAAVIAFLAVLRLAGEMEDQVSTAVSNLLGDQAVQEFRTIVDTAKESANAAETARTNAEAELERARAAVETDHTRLVELEQRLARNGEAAIEEAKTNAATELARLVAQRQDLEQARPLPLARPEQPLPFPVLPTVTRCLYRIPDDSYE